MANVFNISATAEEIASLVPDVLTLQEVDNMTRRHPLDEVQYISKHVGLPYTAFAPWRPFEGGQYGIAILSRHKILDVRRHGYVKPELGLQGKCEVQKPLDFCQGILAIKIAPPAYPPLWIITTHIAADGSQAEEAKQLVAYVTDLIDTSDAKQALVTGDFNEPPTGTGPRYLAKFWQDTFDHCFIPTPYNLQGFTFSSEAPSRRIDYIWATNAELAKCQRTWTPISQASDHFPYVGDW